MKNNANIKKLNNIIERELLPIIDRDYVLLDVPDHDNIGDHLIWEGEEHFLKRVNHNNLYTCSLHFYDVKKVPENCLILLQGGGNFGDLYPVVNQFRLKIIRDHMDKKILFFPQTIHYNNRKNLEKDAKIVNSHPNLIICLRDESSFEIARENFINAELLLVPDMAFCIDPEDMFRKGARNKTLIMMRRDAEQTDYEKDISKDNNDILDWPTFNMARKKRYKRLRFEHRMDRVAKLLLKSNLTSFLIDPKSGLKRKNRRQNFIKIGLDFFADYETIYTTRLHGLILGILMGKNMKVMDNNYGKLSSFYNCWLKDFKDVEIVD